MPGNIPAGGISHRQSLANMLACYDEAEALSADLSTDEWTVQSLCPEWNVHGCTAHLAAVEHVLSGWEPHPENIPFGGIGPFMEEASAMSGPELHERFVGLLNGRRAELAAMTDEQLDAPSATPVGPGTYGRFMAVRVFDFWVHHRDMTIPLGRSSSDGGPAAEQALDEVHMSLGYIAGKKIGLEDGMSMAVRLNGPVEKDLFVQVDGRAAVVDDVASPDLELLTDSTTFVMLACGRIDPQEQIDAGNISWSGDDTWGHKAASSLRFTM